jgi:hypothetical protein
MPPFFLGFGGVTDLHTSPDDVLSRIFDHLDQADQNSMNSAINMILNLRGIDIGSSVRGLVPISASGPPTTMFRPKL